MKKAITYRLVKAKGGIILLDYYSRSIQELKEMLRIKEITKEDWERYKTGKPLWGADNLMWVFAQTEDWEYFTQKVKEEMEGK